VRERGPLSFPSRVKEQERRGGGERGSAATYPFALLDFQRVDV
jgi:hypothetical protein